MNSDPKKKLPLKIKIGKKMKRKLHARNTKNETWFGLGMMGLIGWSVMTPTLIGSFCGAWLDKNYTSHYSFTLVFLIAGLSLGCLNAWHWISQEHKNILKENQEDKDE